MNRINGSAIAVAVAFTFMFNYYLNGIYICKTVK